MMMKSISKIEKIIISEFREKFENKFKKIIRKNRLDVENGIRCASSTISPRIDQSARNKQTQYIQIK